MIRLQVQEYLWQKLRWTRSSERFVVILDFFTKSLRPNPIHVALSLIRDAFVRDSRGQEDAVAEEEKVGLRV